MTSWIISGGFYHMKAKYNLPKDVNTFVIISFNLSSRDLGYPGSS